MSATGSFISQTSRHSHLHYYLWLAIVFVLTVKVSLAEVLPVAKTTLLAMRNRGILGGISLNVDVELINHEYKETTKIGYCMGDSTYRHDGFSIGKDYLRLEGRTITRGELVPTALELQNLIGQGAFSKVYKGLWKQRAVKHDYKVTPVAVKEFCLMDCSQQRRDMLLKELRALCKIKSECLVKLEGAFLHEDTVTMVLEYMDCGSLEDVLKHNQKFVVSMEDSVTASVAFQMLCGLSYLHNERIIHRDIKPGNVLIHSDGSVKLCDFGLASLSDKSLQTTVVGTTRYMAPERLRARPYGRSSDLWSFGLVVLECLTGEIPWKEADSIVSLVITAEETPIDDLLKKANLPSFAREFLSLILQHAPGTFLSRVFVMDKQATFSHISFRETDSRLPLIKITLAFL